MSDTNRAVPEEAVIVHNALLIKISKSFMKVDTFEAVQAAWRLNRVKSSQADIVLAVDAGNIVDVFVADEWLEVTRENFPDLQKVPGYPEFVGDRIPGRTGFKGQCASQEIRTLYIGKGIPDKSRKRGAANPIQYTWEV